MTEEVNPPSVLLFALGGTIAMVAGQGEGVVPTLSGDSLVAAVPQLEGLATVITHSFRQLPGAHLTFDDIEALAQRIEQSAADGVRGVVVTQRTDTIEEAAFALDCLLPLDIPVVVTGAMRNPTVAGADGPANVLAAVQVAASDAARGLGCLVVMNDEVHAARFVRKMHTSNVAAFGSPGVGAIGWVTEGRVRIATRPPRLPAIPALLGVSRAARVVLVTIALGDDGTVVRALRTSGEVNGVVVQATGGGHDRLPLHRNLNLQRRRCRWYLPHARSLARYCHAHTGSSALKSIS